jgi:hypothetical protein
MNFRGKNIFNFVKLAESKLLQILLHPIHFSDNGSGYVDVFKDMFYEKINSFDNDARVIYTYAKDIEGRRLLDAIMDR